jgi:DNA-binding response OmpR family regulator
MRLLLVEHEHPHSAHLQRQLRERGFHVDVARDGVTGDLKVRSADYQTILLNRQLPHGDALGLLQSWRRAGVSANVVVLTPRRTTADEVRCLDLGADDYLTIPFEPEELFARLRALARRRQPVREDVIRIADLEIDTAAHVVRRRGNVVALTRREYALFEFLARNRGQVVSRAMIWRDLYDVHDAGTSNVVDVYVRYLRKKIDRNREQPLIVTYYGRGYMLRDEQG